MSNFFSNLVRGKPVIAIKSFWTDEDLQDIHNFINDDPKQFYISAGIGFPLKYLEKSIRKMLNSSSMNPANINLGIVRPSQAVPDDYIGSLLRPSSTVLRQAVLIGGSAADKLERDITGSPDSSVLLGGLWYTLPPPWCRQSGIESLTHFVSEAWLIVARRTGVSPVTCVRCSEDLELDDEDCCHACGIYDESYEHPPLIDMYKTVVEYEKSSGNKYLKRVGDVDE